MTEDDAKDAEAEGARQAEAEFAAGCLTRANPYTPGSGHHRWFDAGWVLRVNQLLGTRDAARRYT